MSFPSSFKATGGLFAQRRAESSEVEFGPANVTEETLPVAGWTGLILKSPVPLIRGEDYTSSGGTFIYHLIVRRSGTRFLLVSHHASLVNTLIEHAELTRLVFSPTVYVQRAVTELAQVPDTYRISTVHARVEGFGQSLRTVRLFGDDLADAKLFRDMLPQLSPYRATLRDAVTQDDTMTISSRGDIGFYYNGAGALRGIDRALAFFSKRKYIEWGE